MDMDVAVNADNKEQLQVEETGDSCILDYIEIVPVARDTDGSCTTECVSGDWLAEVDQENLAVVKHESDDVCCAILICVVFSLLQQQELTQMLGISHVFCVSSVMLWLQ